MGICAPPSPPSFLVIVRTICSLSYHDGLISPPGPNNRKLPDQNLSNCERVVSLCVCTFSPALRLHWGIHHVQLLIWVQEIEYRCSASDELFTEHSPRLNHLLRFAIPGICYSARKLTVSIPNSQWKEDPGCHKLKII